MAESSLAAALQPLHMSGPHVAIHDFSLVSIIQDAELIFQFFVGLIRWSDGSDEGGCVGWSRTRIAFEASFVVVYYPSRRMQHSTKMRTQRSELRGARPLRSASSRPCQRRPVVLVSAAHVYDAVIVGAGISGLTSAQALASKHGMSNFLVTEARERVGGNLTSMQGDGFIWEEGPNSFQPNDFMLQIAVRGAWKEKGAWHAESHVSRIMSKRDGTSRSLLGAACCMITSALYRGMAAWYRYLVKRQQAMMLSAMIMCQYRYSGSSSNGI